MLHSPPTPIPATTAPPQSLNFFRQRFRADDFMGLPFTLLLCGLLSLPLLQIGLGRALASGWSQSLDQRVDQAMHALRITALINPALWITYLGGPMIVTSMVLLALIILWLRRQTAYIFPMGVAVIGCGLFTLLGKALFPRVRPPDAVYTTEQSLSFPSGHAAQAIAAYGFIFYFLWRTRATRQGRVLVLLSGGLVIAAIIFSRLYLSVHYLSDIWSGVLLGAVALVVGIGISEWRFTHVKPETSEGVRPQTVKWAIGGLIAAEIILFIFTVSRFQAGALPHGAAFALRPVAVRSPPRPPAVAVLPPTADIPATAAVLR